METDFILKVFYGDRETSMVEIEEGKLCDFGIFNSKFSYFNSSIFLVVFKKSFILNLEPSL